MSIRLLYHRSFYALLRIAYAEQGTKSFGIPFTNEPFLALRRLAESWCSRRYL